MERTFRFLTDNSELSITHIIIYLPQYHCIVQILKLFYILIFSLFLYYSFYDHLRIYFYLLHSNLFLLIETKCYHIALIQMIAVQVINQLFFSLSVILLSMPDLQFDYISFSKIVYNHICPALIPCLSLNVVVTYSVNNWSEIQQEVFSAFFFNEFLIPISVNIMKMNNKPF